MRYLVIIPNYWGVGDTIDLAFKQVFKESGSRARSKRIVFQFDPVKTTKVCIECLGNLSWYGEKPVEVERKGM